MKKTVVLLFCFVLALALAACGQDQPVSDTDISGAITEDSYDPQANEPAPVTVAEGDITQLESLLGGKIDFPESYGVTHYSVVADTQAQLQFPLATSECLCRIALGQADNMSGLTKTFDHNETVDVDGHQVSLRYNDGGQPSTSGVADCYDSVADVSYMVYIMQDANAKDLTDIMSDLIASFSLGE